MSFNQTSPGYPSAFAGVSQAHANAATQPRELGLAERLNGIEGGLSELVRKLNTMHQRMSPFPEPASAKSELSCDGIVQSMTRAEVALREANNLADGLINLL